MANENYYWRMECEATSYSSKLQVTVLTLKHEQM